MHQSNCEITIGSKVKMTCVESKMHPRSNWRAVIVELIDESQNSEDMSLQSSRLSLTESLLTDMGIRIEPVSMVFSEAAVGTTKIQYFTVSTEKRETAKLLSVSLASLGTPYSLFIDDKLVIDCLFPCIIRKEKPLFVKVVLNSEDVGRNETFCKFCFENGQALRKVSSTVFSPDELMFDTKSLMASTSHGGKSHGNALDRSRNTGSFVPGVKPVYSSKAGTPVRFHHYPVPDQIKSAVMDKRDMSVVCPELLMPLSAKNYQAKFHALLYIEEVESDLEMAVFDLNNVQMRPDNEFLCLEVPGLSEGRPSLLVGDRILMKQSNDIYGFNSPCNEAYIHKVTASTIFLRFNEAFHRSYDGYEVDVQFLPNRNSFKKAHLAVDYSSNFPTWLLFPQWLEVKQPLYVPGSKSRPRVVKPSRAAFGYGYEVNVPFAAPVMPLLHGGIRNNTRRDSGRIHRKAQPLDTSVCESPRQSREFFNPNLNERQQAAVRRILAAECRPIPYILFGPPGTGKTITVVESILQVFVCIPESRILACAPSNSAADLIVQRINSSGIVGMDDAVRFNGANRSLNSVPDDIIKYCCNDMDELETIVRYRIVVCTCTTAGNFFSLELKPSHFTHVFVDEAGQATEPETMVPLVLTAGNPEAMVILAGDPMQLGPVLRSHEAEEYGLGESFLARLSNRKLYARDESVFAKEGNYNPKVMTKLVDNYRSHFTLLTIPSRIFYNDELIACADGKLVDTFVNWQHLPNKEMPLIFCGVRGNDLRENDSPSWFNTTEVVQVVKYVKLILDDQMVPSYDIGIITPYRKQVEKLRQFMATFEFGKMKVGSVEEFQGQERQVIILSTVRSDESKVESDVFHNLGFLSNPRRFNVSITRSQALLIIVGNPFVLMKDQYWNSFMEYAIMNGCYVGCEPPQKFVQNQDDYIKPFIATQEVMEETFLPLDEEVSKDIQIRNGDVSTLATEIGPEALATIDNLSVPMSSAKTTETGSPLSINLIDTSEKHDDSSPKSPVAFAQEVSDRSSSAEIDSGESIPFEFNLAESRENSENASEESNLIGDAETFASRSSGTKSRPISANSVASGSGVTSNGSVDQFNTSALDSNLSPSYQVPSANDPVWKLTEGRSPNSMLEGSSDMVDKNLANFESGGETAEKLSAMKHGKPIRTPNTENDLQETEARVDDLESPGPRDPNESEQTPRVSEDVKPEVLYRKDSKDMYNTEPSTAVEGSINLNSFHLPDFESGVKPVSKYSTSTLKQQLMSPESPSAIYSDFSASPAPDVGSDGMTIDSELSTQSNESKIANSFEYHRDLTPNETLDSSKTPFFNLTATHAEMDSEMYDSIEPFPEELETLKYATSNILKKAAQKSEKISDKREAKVELVESSNSVVRSEAEGNAMEEEVSKECNKPACIEKREAIANLSGLSEEEQLKVEIPEGDPSCTIFIEVNCQYNKKSAGHCKFFSDVIINENALAVEHLL